MKQIEVIAGILSRGGRVLVAKRGRAMSRPGLWEFPGGTVERGETAEGCLARELAEELGIEVRVGERVLSSSHEDPALRILLHAHRVELVRGEPAALEHEEIAWLLPEELGRLALSPADLPIAARLLAEAESAREEPR
jgi:mutator protein MutT